MKEALFRLAKGVNRSPHPYDPSTATFMQLDLRRMKEEMRLLERARERGEANLPRPESTQFDDVEQEVEREVISEAKRCTDVFHDNMRTYGERLQGLDIAARVSEIDVAAREAMADFRVQVKTDLDELYNLRADVTEVEKEFKKFKEEHQLRRTAHYPEAVVLHLAILAVIFFVEVALNATFLGEGHQLGLLGGMGLAAGIALLNVVGSFLLGWKAFPSLFHRSFFRKLAVLLFVLGYIPAVGGFNLFVGHFREAFSVRVSAQDVVHVVQRVLADPLGLQDFQSWLLVGLGCLFAVIAAGDGMAFDDFYPGYGRVSRKRKAVNSRYASEKARLIEDLAERKGDATEAMRAARDDVNKRRLEFYAILEARTRLRRKFQVHQEYLETAARDLLATYRQANRQARKAAAPAYFDERFTLTRVETDASTEDTEASRAKVEEEVKRVGVILNQRTEEMFTKYENVVAAFHQIEDLIEDRKTDEPPSQAA